jgi:hypothetical protein
MMMAPVTLVVALAVAAAPVQSQLRRPVPLDKAQRDGLVTVDIIAKGGSSGDVISIVLRRKVSTHLRLILAAGTVLTSTSPSVQNMLVLSVKGESTSAK